MKFYHGGANDRVLDNIREECPSLTHGNGWKPGKKGKVLDREHPYFLDNGAFTSAFNEKEWISDLEKMKEFDSEPDFVVLPDVFNDAEATPKRHLKYVDIAKKFGWSYYYVAQPPFQPEKTIRRAVELDADGIFLGGSWNKKSVAGDYIDEAKAEGLKFHIGMPKDYYWAWTTGADSMDSVTIGRNEDYERVRSLHRRIKRTKERGIKTRQKRLNSLM